MITPPIKDVPDPLGRLGQSLLGIYFLLMPLVLCALTAIVWPITQPGPTAQSDPITSSWLGSQFNPPLAQDLTLILLVVTTGALGSYIHSATSFADYAGNRRLAASWVWWYVLRTFIGLCLALIFYFVVRGGLLSATSAAGSINPFGIAAVSALVGMFSKQATDKLREVFDTLFRTDRPVGRADRLANPIPEIASVEPPASPAVDVTLTVTGQRFVPSSVVRLNGLDQQTTYLSPTQLRADIPASALTPLGPGEVTVFNPAPGGGVSTAKPFTIQ